jgi:hypothetical protein
MQQTPLCPLPQGQQIWTARVDQVTQGACSFMFPVARQTLEQPSCVANVYVVAGLHFVIDPKPIMYTFSRINIHVLLLNSVHCFFSLRDESDFSVDAGLQPLIEAKQLNFWKYSNLSTYNNAPALDALKTGAIQ